MEPNHILYVLHSINGQEEFRSALAYTNRLFDLVTNGHEVRTYIKGSQAARDELLADMGVAI